MPLKPSLRSYLVKLVLVAMLPVILFSVIVVARLIYQQQNDLEKNLKKTASALSLAVDQQIATVISNLEVFVAMENFQKIDLRDFHGRLKQATTKLKGWDALSLCPVEGKCLLSTYLPYGAELNTLHDLTFFQNVVKTRQPSISDYRIGRISKNKIISVGVPVIQNGNFTHVLIGSLNVRAFSELLKAQNLPKNWTVALFDRNFFWLARSQEPENFIGVEATNLLNKIDPFKAEGVFHHKSPIGEDTYGVFFRSKFTGWTIILDVPYSTLANSSSNIIFILAIGGLVLLSIGILWALKVGQRISDPMKMLTGFAEDLGKGKIPPLLKSEVEEVNVVADALQKFGEQSRRDLELRETFLSVASHELKTPLTSIYLQFEILKREVLSSGLKDDTNRMAKTFERFYGQLQRLKRLTDDLLDVTRMAAGRMDLNLEHFDISSTIKDICANFESEAKEKGTPIHFKDPGPVFGQWDNLRIEQVFLNLISNSIKFGEGKPIDVLISTENQMVIIKISDHGIGIASEDFSRIFERFERASNPGFITGLGLGLYICKEIVNLHRGQIEVKSHRGEGSTFTVRLPL